LMASAVIVRNVRAFAGETVSVRWRYPDGSDLEERYTAPPETVKQARERGTPDVLDLTGKPPLPPGHPERGGGL
jgi:hypothetical protein